MTDSDIQEPGILQMTRAPFLSSVIAPIIAGSALSYVLTDAFNWPAFVIVLFMGIGLHVATNVYNDIYDTKQGTDVVNVHRNEFSGGSGILQNFPHLMNKMYWIARSGLILAFICTVLLMFQIDRSLWPHLWGLFLLSAFFSKFYTAAPVKLAYRGLGEISVWFAFGPMAILVATVSQNLGFSYEVVLAMPATGLSTLSILLVGQLIDLDADTAGGKRGVAARLGTGFTRWLYLFVQSVIIIDIILLGTMVIENGWWILLALIPYVLLFPKAWKIIYQHHDNENALKPAAGINVQIHLLFSLFLILGLILRAVL